MMKKMMERFRMIRENQKKNGTKGFSMIELIIVIAVMAILVALIGTQLIPYLDKSRRTRDLDTLNAVLTAVQSVVTDYELDPTSSTDLAKITQSGSSELASLETYLGYTWGNAAAKYTSKAAKGQAPVISTTTVDGKPAIQVTAGTLFVTSGGTSGDTSSSTGNTNGGNGS